MYQPVTHYIVSGELAHLITDSTARDPAELCLFTVAIFEPERPLDEDYYIIFEIGNNAEKGGCAGLTQHEYDSLYHCITNQANNAGATRTVAGNTVPSDAIGGSPQQKRPNVFLPQSYEVTIDASPLETPSTRGVDLTISRDSTDGGSVTLTNTQCEHFADRHQTALAALNRGADPSIHGADITPEVVDSAGNTAEATHTMSLEQAVGKLIDADTLTTPTPR
jgi:hypothetical protein